MRTYRGAFFVIVFVPSLLILSSCRKQDASKIEENTSEQNAWELTKVGDIEFKCSSFCFVRIQYSSRYGGGYEGARGRPGSPGRGYRGYSGVGRWAVDYPDSDLNLSARFQEVTGLPTDPNGKVMQLTDTDLNQYPFIYISEPGDLVLSEEEVASLRKYLLDGGFLMADDFWGEDEWHNVYYEIKRVFPEREPLELSLNHPIFHCFYDIDEKPQVPSIGHALSGRDSGVTWERHDAREVHYKALYNDKGRMMAIFCHNTDLADGWEREGENEWYYREFSLKKAFPMGINIVVYALTH
ncbi:MAG: DUF4159 domain-containing protein [Chloroflexi bacterium]|nr:DUF4159 domain-containing protein [Chloroflexota bacterium]MBL7189491.1 DUF4159 domain-containing protein [Phycisphaerae bacterium]